VHTVSVYSMSLLLFSNIREEEAATKKSHSEARDRYKTMLLAVQYRMSVQSLATRVKVSTFEAHEMLRQHREHSRSTGPGPMIG
jgi:hypothetical protein